jgi:hypothetical protein
MSLAMLCVDLSPFLVLVMCSFVVAGDGGRYVDINSLVRPGNVSNSYGCFKRTINMAERGGQTKQLMVEFCNFFVAAGAEGGDHVVGCVFCGCLRGGF